MDTKLLGLILQGDKKNKQEFNRIKETYEELSKSKANTITSSANGESIVLSDSADSTLASLRVMGKSEQFTTTGAQLIIPTIRNTVETNGVTINNTEGGNAVVNGTVTTDLWTNLGDAYLTAGETYTLTGASEIRLLVWDAVAPGYLTEKLNGTAMLTFTATNSGRHAIVINNFAGNVLNNVLINGMLNAGSTLLPYEPYTGGIPSPNPQYPQEIMSAGDDGNIEANVYGKNLFNPDTNGYMSNLTGEITPKATAFAMSKYLPVKSFMTAIVKDYDASATESYAYRISWYDSERKWIKNNTFKTTKTVLQVPTNAKYFRASAGYDDTLMICYGNADTYESCEKQPLTIPTPNGLPGIKVTDPSIATYTDEAGQMWCADEVDFERGVYVKRIEKVDITRDKYTRSDLYETYNKFSFTTNILYDTDNYVQRQLPTMSNRFIANAASIVGYFNTLTVANGGWSGCARSIFTVDKSIASLDDFMNYVGDDCYVLTLLPTPIETPLSESELNAYKALHTNYPVTTILNDSGAHMEVKYTADKKNYIDNKFAQITNAVLSMGSNI